jgi:L-gulonate 5-dehydrogenase
MGNLQRSNVEQSIAQVSIAGPHGGIKEGSNMYKVVLEEPKVVRVAQTTPKPVGDHEALVRLRSAGICGSDLAAYRGTSPMVTYPRVLGHELVVDVIACPDRPELVGQRAVVDPMVRCGHCRACRAGRYNCCLHLQVMGVHIDGGMQEETTIASDRLYAVPSGMPDDVAVLTEPFTIAYHAVERSEIRAGEVGVVFGAGAIGLLIAVVLMRARGCQAIVIDIDEERLRTAGALGAITLHGDAQALTEGVRRWTGGEMAAVVFEAVGNPYCTCMTTELVAQAGRIVLIGWNKGPVEVDTVTLMRKEVDLVGSRNSRNAFGPVLQLLGSGVVDPQTFITHRFGIQDADAALRTLDDGAERALKIVIENKN